MVIHPRKGKRLAIVALLLALVVLIGAGVPLRRLFLEEWYLRELDSKDEATRELALEKLGEMQSARAVPRLMKGLGEAFRDINSRATPGYVDLAHPFARALIRIGAPAVPALIEALKDPGNPVHDVSYYALGEIAAQVEATISAIFGALEEAGFYCPSVLSRMGKAAVPRLIQALEQKQAREGFRIGVAEALGSIGPEARAAVPALIRTLKDDSAFVRGRAAVALGSVSSESTDAVLPLKEALNDGDQEVRLGARVALKMLEK
jgi:HEAT repeat protein